MATILALVLTMTPTVINKDYGVHGHTFSIEEEDLIEYLKKKSQHLTPQDINRKIKGHYRKRLTVPSPVKNLQNAKSHTIHYFDPTIVAKQAIKDAQGNTIVVEGACYSPLQHFSLKEELLFFDGDNPSHLGWAHSLGEHKKWILTSGHPLELENQESRPIYFDQYGLLTQKLKITAIPARVSQEGYLLKIESIPIESKLCE